LAGTVGTGVQMDRNGEVGVWVVARALDTVQIGAAVADHKEGCVAFLSTAGAAHTPSLPLSGTVSNVDINLPLVAS
jgi:hypothetical protein